MRAGAFPHYLTLYRATETRNANGGVDYLYGPTPIKLWCSVKSTGGTELDQAGQLVPVVSYTVETRYRTDVEPTDRLVFRGKAIEIASMVDPDGLQRSLRLECRSTT